MKSLLATAVARVLPLLVAALLFPLPAHAQRAGRGGAGGTRGAGARGQNFVIRDPTLLGNQQLIEQSLSPAFKNDVFTFARLRYNSGSRGWNDDFDGADLNMAWRLFQVTSMKIRPYATYISITPGELAAHPFVYVTATNALNLSVAEATALRHYMLTGGFVMAEDFWGDSAWSHARQEFKRIFPDLEPVELGLDHPIFHNVFEFKYLPQIPSAGYGYTPSGPTYDTGHDYSTGDHFPHYYGLFDGKHRMMAIICRNNHYGDGWEHEGENHDYFDRFSEPQAYPMFINIIFYAMTH